MPRRRNPVTRRSSGPDKPERQSQKNDAAWTAEQVQGMLANPVYGYGWVLEPAEMVIHAVLLLREQLAREQRERGHRISLDDLDQRFQSLLTNLVRDGMCTRRQDTSPLVSKETWLKAQQVSIDQLSTREDI